MPVRAYSTPVVKKIRGEGVPPNHLLLMKKYKSQVDQVRRQYAERLKSLVKPKRVVLLKNRHEKRNESEARWKNFIDKLKEKLDDPKSSLNADRHRCRPKFDYTKSEEHRRDGLKYVERYKLGTSRMRQAYMQALKEDLRQEPLITMENLDQKIMQAISNPVNYNKSPEMMVKGILMARERIVNIRRAIRLGKNTLI